MVMYVCASYTTSWANMSRFGWETPVADALITILFPADMHYS